MGAWGPQPFDNDDAADFAGELRDAGEADAVGGICEDACRRILTDSALELGQVAEAIAATVVVGVATAADEALVRAPYGPGPPRRRAAGTLPAVRGVSQVRCGAAAGVDVQPHPPSCDVTLSLPRQQSLARLVGTRPRVISWP